jgi:soluble lytic murein transglycosylase-like protein
MVWTNFKELDRAQDIATFCRRYAVLSDAQKVNVWSNLFAATSYYESGWKPTASSVDVGTPSDENTWSVGLLQLSVVDQANYGLPFGFTFADLQNPVKNLQLGVKIMAKQINKHGRVLIPAGGTGLYWATLHPGGRYDASKSIAKITARLSFCN